MLTLKIVLLFISVAYSVGWVNELIVEKRTKFIPTLIMVVSITWFVTIQWLI